MLNTYIKNRGTTKTIIHSNNHNHVNQTNWDADYDGEIANISIDTESNGNRKKFDFILDNEDLANILNVQSVNIPIHKRLKMDFDDKLYYQPENNFIELNTNQLENIDPKIIKYNNIPDIEKINRPHISSPITGEELIIPLTIDRKTIDNYTLTPKRRHRRLKSHITHKVYKKRKSTKRHETSHRYHRKSSSSRKKLSI